jgi:hypothetical protein
MPVGFYASANITPARRCSQSVQVTSEVEALLGANVLGCSAGELHELDGRAVYLCRPAWANEVLTD